MNRYQSAPEGEARLRYRDGGYDVVIPGTYVVCAVTGLRITVDRLRYWDVVRQEAYANASAALQALRRQKSGAR